MLDIVTAIENNSVFSSIKKGFILLIPVLLTGAVALMLRNFPLDSVQYFLNEGAGQTLNTILLYIYDSTFGFLSAYLVLSISYYYSFTFHVKDFSLQVMAMITSFACFVASFGGASGSLEISHFGHIGVFTAMICAIFGTWLFFTLCKLIHRMSPAHAVGADVNYRTSMASLVPLVLCILVFIVINLVLNAAFGVSNFNDLISSILVAIFRNAVNGLASGVLFLLALNLLWFFGIHAGNALDEVSSIVFVPANTDPTAIVSKTFLDNFALIGGCGATICLLFALLIAARSPGNRRLAWSAAPTLVFNINEILVYGLPIVLNVVMLIPFIVVPIVSMLIAYWATIGGLMPIINETVIWTTPPLMSGYIATGGWGGVVTQIIIIVVGTLIYIPFVRISERVQQSRENMHIKKMTDMFVEAQENGTSMKFMDKHDDIGITAKSMLVQLRSDILDSDIPMFYQPQVDKNYNVVGAEALLRWNYAGQRILPPLVIALAQEDRYYNELTYCILKRVCADIAGFRQTIKKDVKISVNITVEQLNDASFVERVIELVNTNGIVGNLVLEVTEETSIMYYDKISQHMELLEENGVAIAIDDFSMGQTSLKYLQTNVFDYVKLDGSLVRKINVNPRSRDIIESIITLGKTLGFTTVAEYVETDEIRQELLSLGCKYFQGYLFSPAIPAASFVEYYEKNNGVKPKKKDKLKA